MLLRIDKRVNVLLAPLICDDRNRVAASQQGQIHQQPPNPPVAVSERMDRDEAIMRPGRALDGVEFRDI